MKILYGIDYKTYVCGGLADQKLAFMGEETLFFRTESEMLKQVARLKEERTVDNIKPFIAEVVRQQYTI